MPNIRRLRQWRNRLPLSKIRRHEIKISTKNTPSTAMPAKDAYTISLRETIERVLNNPRLCSQMYFGSGIEVEEKTEFWHGEIWKESPLFGQDTLDINRGYYFFIYITYWNNQLFIYCFYHDLHNLEKLIPYQEELARNTCYYLL